MSIYYETTADKFVFKVKRGILYSKDEVWVKTEANENIRVGITDFAQKRAGDLVFAEIRPVGTKLTSGGFIGSYETVKIIQDMLSPTDGEIVEINHTIESKPELINKDPYGEGWVAVIKPTSGLDDLISAEDCVSAYRAEGLPNTTAGYDEYRLLQVTFPLSSQVLRRP